MRLLALPCACLAFSMVACSPSASGPDEVPDPTRLSKRETEARLATSSPDTALYGFALNEPLSLPLCDPGAATVLQTCLSGDEIRLTEEELPRELRFPKLYVKVDSANNLQEIKAILKPDSAELVRQLLEITYKKPDYETELFRDMSAWSWNYSDMEVHMFGFSDLASVTLRTAAQRAIAKAEQQKEIEAQEAVDAKRRGL